MEAVELLRIADAIVQWLILPGLAVAWNMNSRISRQEKEILRIVTVQEERQKARSSEIEAQLREMQELRKSVDRLTERLDKLEDRK